MKPQLPVQKGAVQTFGGSNVDLDALTVTYLKSPAV
jgi:hypothetical protein